jgi:hypothetical protein
MSFQTHFIKIKARDWQMMPLRYVEGLLELLLYPCRYHTFVILMKFYVSAKLLVLEKLSAF